MFLVPPIGMVKRSATAAAVGLQFVDSVPWEQVTGAVDISVTLPGGVQEGDLLIAAGGSGAVLGATSVTGPSTLGWTSFGELNTGNVSAEVFYKFAGPSEFNYIMQFSGGITSVFREQTLLVFRNAGTPTLQAGANTATVDPFTESWTDPSDGSFELVIGTGTNGLDLTIGIDGITPGSFTNDIVDENSTPPADAGLMWSSYRDSADAGTVNYQADFSVTLNDILWNRIRIPEAVTAPAFVAIAEGEALSGSPLIINKPTGVIEGDLMIAFVATGEASGPSWSDPGGWTEHYDNAPVVAGIGFGVACYSKVAGAGEGGTYTFTSSEGMRARQGMIVAYRGGSSLFDVSPLVDITSSSAATSHSIAGVEASESNTLLVLGMLHHDDGATTQTEPTSDPAGSTKRLWSNNSLRDRHAMGVYDEQLSSVGATGTRALTTAQACGVVTFRATLGRGPGV